MRPILVLSNGWRLWMVPARRAWWPVWANPLSLSRCLSLSRLSLSRLSLSRLSLSRLSLSRCLSRCLSLNPPTR